MLNKVLATEHFQQFAGLIKQELQNYEKNTTETQKKDLEELVELENKFKNHILKSKIGLKVYQELISNFKKTNKVSAIKSYFRERGETLCKIVEYVKNEEIGKIFNFNINYQFCSWVLQKFKFKETDPIYDIFNKIQKKRLKLIIMNLPLAVSRAKMFRQHTPFSHLSYLDLIQMASEGLIVAIDKYVLPYSTVFRSVIIGRITSNFITGYNSTMLRFHPYDKSKLYRTRKIQGRDDLMSLEEIAEKINKLVESKKDYVLKEKTTADEIESLLIASSPIPIDCPKICDTVDSEESKSGNISKIAAPDSCRPDFQMEDIEIINLIKVMGEQLTIFEKKVLLMKGICL